MECVHTADSMRNIILKTMTTNNRQFDSGAQRDVADDKLRMSLVPQNELKRVMKRYLDGANKYGENNWMRGMPVSVYYDCAHRHLDAWWSGDSSEDHAAAVVWNMLCAMWTESNNNPDEHLDDLNDKWKYPSGQDTSDAFDDVEEKPTDKNS